MTDTVAIAVALLVAYLLRFALPAAVDGRVPDVPVTDTYELYGIAIAAMWLLTLATSRSRQPRVLSTGLTEFRRVAGATLAAFGNVAILAYLFALPLSRVFFLVALPLGIVLLVGTRFAMRQVLHESRARGYFMERGLVVGRVEDVRRVQNELNRARACGIAAHSTYVLAATEDETEARLERAQVVATASAMGLDAVIVAGEIPGGADAVRELGWELEETRADLILAARLTDIAGPRIHLRPLTGVPMVQVSLPRFTGWTYAVKRAMDVTISAVALLVLAPVFLLIAGAIKLDDGGPVFYRQIRSGANGEPFFMLKFRSMGVNAHAMRAQILDQNEGAGPLFKMRHDPRVTRVGKYLRMLSLDELPQFVNVLLGTMSVVGPRPPLPEEVAQYDRKAHRRLLIKPGITGLWQVSGRSNLSWDESLRLDLNYVENWSPLGDLALIARTGVAVLRREGAY